MSDQAVTTDLLMQRLPGDLLTILLDPANPADRASVQATLEGFRLLEDRQRLLRNIDAVVANQAELRGEIDALDATLVDLRAQVNAIPDPWANIPEGGG